jgi:hypothetical protein
MYEKRKTTSTP